MKQPLLFKQIILVILLTGFAFSGWAQILYEDFNYPTPAFCGGNGDAGATSNNWTTHSVTSGQTTTLNVEDGSLTYDGLFGSTGNKILNFSNANATSRDINRGFTATATTLYYSALVNIVDNSQLTANGDYFLHFGATSGAVNTSFGARLGAKLGATSSNFRFMILNTSGGTSATSFTDNGADLNFGTTYLVVVKYDASAAPTVASLWVNPASLGGVEPTGAITNNIGTSTFATFGSICLRNNATSPKANVDEIRVGETWAAVTPISVGMGEKNTAQNTSIYPNPCNGFFNTQIPDNGNSTITVCNAQGLAVKTIVTTEKSTKVETSGLATGLYFVIIQNSTTSMKEVHKLLVK